ncbi:MFS transporter [Nocardioides aurantiacus]|uniref:Putative MFS family arabinose efflux permease n=1 Tax=Nocardioides aurantiacus TaxID=86796 RepID=A0A3N2CZ38_9ACTN|nr:MFS transporter [Nocardioides aurantiacus]ROR92454.1 putative MFS family arabinose efflux permease [Nocardioides aurantiacus]
MTTSTHPVPRTSLTGVARAGGRDFLVLDAAARLPTAMLPLGLLLLVANRTGSYGTGGLAVAALSLGAAAGGPLVGALADRLGQRGVALVVTLVQAAALLTLLVSTLPLPLLLGLGAVVGLSNPQMGAMARTRWSARGRGRDDERGFVSAAMALEGALDEVSFVLGPVLVGTLAALVAPAAPLWLALGLAVVAHLGFGLHRSALRARPRRSAHEVHSPLPVARLAVLLLALGSVGVVFGASQTGLAARLALTGDDALTGLVYGVGAVGSAVTALLTTRLPERIGHELRIVVSGGAMVAAGLLLAAATTPLALAGAMLLLGTALAPTLISAYALAERLAPPDWATTTMTALSTANVVGVAAGAAAAGGLVDGAGPTAALLVVAVAGASVLLAGLVARASYARRTGV